MRRTASSVIRDLEIRVARLEKVSMIDPFKYEALRAMKGLDPTTLQGNPGSGKDMFFPEDLPTKVYVSDGDFIVVLGGDRINNIRVRNIVETFASEESSHISIQRDVKYPIYEDISVSQAAFVLRCVHGDLTEFAPLSKKLKKIGVKFDVDSRDKRALRVAHLKKKV